MLVKAFLRRLIVIGSDDEDRVGAGAFGMLRKFDRLGGRVGTCAGHDRHPAAGLLDAPFDNFFVFVVGERRAFAGRADRNEPIGAFGNLPIDELAESFLVDCAVLERRHERGK